MRNEQNYRLMAVYQETFSAFSQETHNLLIPARSEWTTSQYVFMMQRVRDKQITFENLSSVFYFWRTNEHIAYSDIAC